MKTKRNAQWTLKSAIKYDLLNCKKELALLDTFKW